ncbi:peptidyl-tRNA hydrolase 2, mitochondrial-like [Planococcus citri]|uniref:peptidyl-tRNA hydrolase 2, mitochondrial-like n=1 Tax=Planococcus citri TaxID=170843 RepID=UPI0031F919B0
MNSRDIVSGTTGLVVGGILTWLLKNKLKRVISIARYATKSSALEPIKMVLVVRPDVRMSSGKLAAQCAHAAVSSYAAAKEYDPQLVAMWESTGQAKIVVSGDKTGEMELYSLAEKAKQFNIVTAIIRDAGRTQLAAGTPTVLGMGPAKAKDLDNVSGHLRLY